MILLGLTGSIGMGKSTTAGMFRDSGIPVHDADAVVHSLYAGRAAPLIEAVFPGTTRGGVVDRVELGRHVLGKPENFRRLEAIVHPLVREERDRFLRDALERGADIAVLDIPLLLENGGENEVDAVVVVTARADEQERRVLARPGMTREKFQAILARQMPDAAKREKADFLVETDHGLEAARRQVEAILTAIRAGGWRRRRSPDEAQPPEG